MKKYCLGLRIIAREADRKGLCPSFNIKYTICITNCFNLRINDTYGLRYDKTRYINDSLYKSYTPDMNFIGDTMHCAHFPRFYNKNEFTGYRFALWGTNIGEDLSTIQTDREALMALIRLTERVSKVIPYKFKFSIKHQMPGHIYV